MENLDHFIKAQEYTYSVAMSEIVTGKKRTHWMWFVFPQIIGLGQSSTAKYYAIKNFQMANEFCRHPVLGNRLIGICNALYQHKTLSAKDIFGEVDSIKLRSSLTLFALIDNPDPIFEKLLNLFFSNKKCNFTYCMWRENLKGNANEQ